MLTAETAINIVEALPEKEVKRFYKMLGVVPAKPKKPKRKAIITDAEATEYLIKKHFSKK